MKQITVTLPDSFYNSFINFFKHIPEVSIHEEVIEDEVPKWQQDLVLNRIKNSKPEDYIPWEDVQKELDEKWLK